MCYPHQLGGQVVRNLRNVRAELQAQAQAHDLGAQTGRKEQDNFDALHLLHVEDHTAFDAYHTPKAMIPSKSSAFVDILEAFGKNLKDGVEVDIDKVIDSKREAIESYDCMQWMKAEEHAESDTNDHEKGQVVKVSSASFMPVKSEIALQYRTKPVKSSSTCVLKKSKWRRRDIGKHLEGEKRRRKARMNRLYILRDLLPKRSSKSTVNGILIDAIEFLKNSIPKEQRAAMKHAANAPAPHGAAKDAPHATLKRGVEPAMVRTGILSSTLFPSLLLDQHGNIVEASSSLSNLVGYPCVLNDMPFMAMLHPDDAHDLAQRFTIFQSWLTPAELINSHATPLRTPMRCTVRLTTYTALGVCTIPVDLELLPIVQGNATNTLVIVLNHPQGHAQ